MARKLDTLLVTFGDTHCGSTRGLMPKKGIEDVDGNRITPNGLQKIIYKQWIECWQTVAEMRKGKRLIIINMGDMVEGIHHETTQVVSNRVETHEAIAVEMFDEAFNIAKYDHRKGDLLAFLAGTEEHTDSGSQSDERVAQDFDGALFDKENSRYTWETLQMEINGLLCDFAHHGAVPGSRYHTKENGLRANLRSIASESLDLGGPSAVPDLVYSGHYHTLTLSGKVYGLNYEIEGVIVPSFQFKTGYAIKVAGYKPADIGLVVTNISKDGLYEIVPLIMRFTQRKRLEV